MSSKPKRDAQKETQKEADSSERQPLPFEPAKSRKQIEKKAEAKVAKPTPVPSGKSDRASKTARNPNSSGIPETVSRRMVKRMAFFCGIPTALGMSTFVASYLIVTRDVFPLPTSAVLLVSLGFFGLGVLGLSYGALSASWDEETPGSALGFSEFSANWGRMTGAWKAEREAAQKAAREAAREAKKKK